VILFHYPEAPLQPPCPFILVALRNRLTGVEVRDVPAQVDTGADQTILTDTLVEALGLSRTGCELIRWLGGPPVECPTYTVCLHIHTFPPHTIEVLAGTGMAWPLLGRDVLNHYRIVLDGPALHLEITPPQPQP
jgi:hypothetical protein